MDDACMKRAIKNGFWLSITTWTLMAVFISCINLIHEGLTIWFLKHCCNNGFDILKVYKSAILLIIFNIVIYLFIFFQTEQQ